MKCGCLLAPRNVFYQFLWWKFEKKGNALSDSSVYENVEL